jgi:HK97 family phage major capsid protein
MTVSAAPCSFPATFTSSVAHFPNPAAWVSTFNFMPTLNPPVSNRQLRPYRDGLTEWARAIAKGERPPHNLATEHSKAHEMLQGVDSLAANQLYVDPANLRGLSAGTQNLGGYLVGVEEAEVVQAYYPVSALAAAGATFETRQGNLAVPTQVTRQTASWLAETDQVTEATVQLGQATGTPHRLSLFMKYTRQLDKQSDVGRFIQSNGMASLGAGIDRGGLVGSGIFGEPTGILGMSGTSVVTFSASATWANALSFVFNVETANVPTDRISFIGAPNVKQKWMNIQQFSGSSDAIWESDGQTIAGRPARVTTNMSNGAIVCGDFSEVRVILFGPLMVTVDPFSSKKSEQIEIILTQNCDVIVPFPGAFCVSSGNAAQ